MSLQVTIRKVLFFLLIAAILIAAMRAIRMTPLAGTSFSREVLADDQSLLRLTLSTDQKYRIYRPLEYINPELVQSVLLSEDKYFYYHFGVNPISLVRAFTSSMGQRKIGASTITMQLVRLQKHLYTRTAVGKIKQILWALVYEMSYSKKEILEAYLNLAPYGANIEGVEAASQIYFSKNAINLNLLECFTLAVIPQNPVKRSLEKTDFKKVTQARARLIELWLKEKPQDKKIISELSLPVLSSRIQELPFLAPHFVEKVLSREPLVLKIQTTLSVELQKKIELIVKNYLESVQNLGVNNAATLLIDARTREVKSWIGSGDYFNSQISGQIDAITTSRSPGSTLKPFVYALAMDEGLIHPSSILKDLPSSFGHFDPENFDRRYLGPISATEALILSRNIPAINLASQLKQKNLYNILQAIQVRNLQPEKHYGLGITIGTAELSPEDLAGLYTSLYHLGEWSPLKLKKENIKSSIRIISRESAYLVLDMLTQTPRDQSSIIDLELKQRTPIAWKTGTSYGFRDAWTAGVFGPYVLVVWLGNFDHSENPHLIGRDLAAPLFFRIVEQFSQSHLSSNQDWHSPSLSNLNIKKVSLCSVSGKLAGDLCPHKKSGWFIPSISPIQTCDLHRQIAISKKTGLRLCGQPHQPWKNEIFEFWSSDVLDHFQKFGIARKVAPTYTNECAFNDNQENGLSPEILSPKHDLKYMISFQGSKNREKIPFKATADADVKKLSWYVNHQFIGKVSPSESIEFDASAGLFEVIVIDDHGRSASRTFEVLNTN